MQANILQNGTIKQASKCDASTRDLEFVKALDIKIRIHHRLYEYFCVLWNKISSWNFPSFGGKIPPGGQWGSLFPKTTMNIIPQNLRFGVRYPEGIFETPWWWLQNDWTLPPTKKNRNLSLGSSENNTKNWFQKWQDFDESDVVNFPWHWKLKAVGLGMLRQVQLFSRPTAVFQIYGCNRWWL